MRERCPAQHAFNRHGLGLKVSRLGNRSIMRSVRVCKTAGCNALTLGFLCGHCEERQSARVSESFAILYRLRLSAFANDQRRQVMQDSRSGSLRIVKE
jgi:hypothetical protein